MIGERFYTPVLRDLPITRGLQLLLPFAERAGTRANDLSGRHNHGTLVNGPGRVWSQTLERWVCSFPGSGTVYVAHPQPFAAVGAFSYSIWLEDVTAGDIAGRWQAPPYGTGTRDLLIRRNSNVLQSFVKDVAGPSYTPASWSGKHHVCVTADGATVRLYWDGVQVGTPGSIAGPYANGTTDWFVGEGHNSGSITGQLADPCIWSRALAPAEIRWLADRRNRLYRPAEMDAAWLGGDAASGTTISVDPVAATLSLPTPTLRKTRSVVPVTALWAPIAPTLHKTRTVEPVTATWTVAAPALTKSTAVDPAVATMAVASPSLRKSITPDPLALTWSIATPTLSKSTAVAPVQLAWTAATVTTSHDAPVIEDALIYDVAVVPALQCRATVEPAIRYTAGLTPAILYRAGVN